MTCDVCHDDQFPGELVGKNLVCIICYPLMPEHVREWLRVNDDVPADKYSAPPREADKRYQGKTWELSRLYLLDEIPKNAETWLIGQSVRYIKRHFREVECLLSYADPSAGHRGTIYQAANWISDGRTDSERKTPRCDYVDTRTGKKYGRKGNMPPDAIVGRIPRISKWRYIYRLRKPQNGRDQRPGSKDA